jgi:hypothetical protein
MSWGLRRKGAVAAKRGEPRDEVRCPVGSEEVRVKNTPKEKDMGGGE